MGKHEKVQTSSEKALSSAYEWVEAAVVSLVAVALVFCFLFRVVGVDGESMLRTLNDQDRLLLTCGYEKAEYGDIVVVSQGEKEPLIKRVIAKAGDIIKIEDEAVYLQKAGETDFVKLSESHAFYDPYGPYILKTMDAVKVPENCVFVMGDNRRNSHDSRAADIGCVSMEDVMGEAFWRVWPLSTFGDIE